MITIGATSTTVRLPRFSIIVLCRSSRKSELCRNGKNLCGNRYRSHVELNAPASSKNSIVMTPYPLSLLAVVTLLLMLPTSAWSGLNYKFSVSTNMEGLLPLASPVQTHATYTGATGPNGSVSTTVDVPLPFPFLLNGVTYSTVGISNEGVIRLGEPTISGIGDNDLTQGISPMIAPFWDKMRVGSRSGSLIRYGNYGKHPRRIFVVEYSNMALGSGGYGIVTQATFQIRLYEKTNVIEFYYENMNPWNTVGWMNGAITTTGSIGIAQGKSFISITPNGGEATASSTVANNTINLITHPINKGMLFKFTPLSAVKTIKIPETANSKAQLKNDIPTVQQSSESSKKNGTSENNEQKNNFWEMSTHKDSLLNNNNDWKSKSQREIGWE